MLVTAVSLNALNLMDAAFMIARQTLIALSALSPRRSIMVDRQNDSPEWIRYQPLARPIGFEVLLLRPNAPDRRADFDTLKATVAAEALVPLVWTESAVTYQLMVAAEEFVANAWFTTASGRLTAPEATPITL